ncbi:MAG: 2-amino-4-hydroxy-6-hydroxymethyldihydropteridine diphosphokinase [Proteobacteria bacterium]|nr:2-amino-4-hydroxy-6-hydroxymethyldihydropteridine diphosphokinase [Pseudomonadota bacterium]
MATEHQIFLAIGSNIVPRKNSILKSLVAIKQSFPDQFEVSSVYLTDPFMQVAQPAYYNCCVRFSADCSTQDLLTFCGTLETSLGRKRNDKKWNSRPIDIDIVLFGNMIINRPDLIIPHYDLANRDFFLKPLLELKSDLVHPALNEHLQQLLYQIPFEKRTHPQRLFKPTI